MKMKIVASEPLKKLTLEADHEGISFNESGGFGMGEWHHHSFSEIDAVVRTANTIYPNLSIQVGTKIYTIKYKAEDNAHKALVDHIITNAQKTVSTQESQ